MKQLTKVLLALALPSAIGVSTASAQNLITVDESGNGNFNGTPLSSSMQTESFSGITTLRYQLPFPAVPGDVYLFEANNPGRVSDVIRFDGNFGLFFFSDMDGPPVDPADAPFPPPVAAYSIVSILENGPEGNNDAFYTPSGSGSDPGDNTAFASYHFISDVTPEPSSLALGVLAGGLVLRRRRPRSIGNSG